MRNKLLLIIFILFLLTSCTQHADADYLIGGKWVATAGYEDEEAKGDPNCHFEEGLEFKDEGTVYNASFDKELDYRLSDRNKETEITFLSEESSEYRYNIHIVNENEMGLEGAGLSENKSCYLERK